METQAQIFPELASPELRDLAASCPEALTDQELMLLCSQDEAGRRGDLFAEVFRRYHSRVTAWCFRITRDRNRSLDLAQEVFFKAYRHARSFRGDARLSTWLFAITRNHCLSFIKKMAADPVSLGESMPPGLRDPTVEPDRDIEREQVHRRMWQIIDSTLEPLEARVITLHYGYEIPLATITRNLELSNPSGAKAYVVNARRKLSRVIRRRGLTSGLTCDLGKSAA
jgi:RNA polymerase sigma-70 factor, ECF subfamily